MKLTKTPITLIFLVILFFIAHRVFFSSTILQQFASYMLYPVLVLQGNIIEPIAKWFIEKKAIKDLNLQLKNLNAENENLLSEIIQLSATQVYAGDIEELLNFKKRYKSEFASIVQILVRRFSEREQYYIINAGSCQGIKQDMIALYNNCLIGKVTEVFYWYSKVLLITDQNCKVAVYCTKTKARGIHEGINKTDKTTVYHISHLNMVTSGDLVLSSGEGLVFPQGFALGRVSLYKRNDLYFDVTVEPLLDFVSLMYCVVCSKDVLS